MWLSSRSLAARPILAGLLITLIVSAPTAVGQAPSGSNIDGARERFQNSDWDGALRILERLSKEADGAVRAEAALLARRIRLGRALAWSDVDARQGKESDAIREFEALALGAPDVTAGAARIARAALAWRLQEHAEARQWMREGLEEWRRIQENNPAPGKGSLEEDVLEFRASALRPGGYFSPLDADGLDALVSSRKPSLYMLAPSVAMVRLIDDRSIAVTVNRPADDTPNVIFLNEEQEAFLKTLLSRFRVDRETAPLLVLIREFFPVIPALQPGDLRGLAGWDVFGPPFVTAITFEDERRTRAEACARTLRGGSCAFFEKRGDGWKFVRQGKLWSR